MNTLRNSKINRYKQFFLADSIYDSRKNHVFLKKRGYIPLIRYNRRNCKNSKIIKKRTFNGKNKKNYKRRFIIEASFAWLKNRPLINQIYEKTLASFHGLLKIACIKLISTRI